MAEQSPEFTQPIPPDNGRTTVREQVRRGLERSAEALRGAQPEELTRPAALRRTMAQNAVLSMGITNLALGALSFVAPAVTGNCDKVINRSKGKLFGVFAVNPTHALVHAGLGAAGLAAQRSARMSERYLQATAVAYGAMAAAGFLKGRNQRKDVYEVMGMAINTADNVLHTTWSLASAIFALQPRLMQGQ